VGKINVINQINQWIALRSDHKYTIFSDANFLMAFSSGKWNKKYPKSHVGPVLIEEVKS